MLKSEDQEDFFFRSELRLHVLDVLHAIGLMAVRCNLALGCGIPALFKRCSGCNTIGKKGSAYF